MRKPGMQPKLFKVMKGYSKAQFAKDVVSGIIVAIIALPLSIALALALELDLKQTQDLIGRAGYALTTSSKFDVIIMYFIREGNYNLFDINAALFEFDQSLLGG